MSAAAATGGADYDSMTVVELKDLAKASGVKGYSAMSKAQLVKALGGGDND